MWGRQAPLCIRRLSLPQCFHTHMFPKTQFHIFIIFVSAAFVRLKKLDGSFCIRRSPSLGIRHKVNKLVLFKNLV
jgi:hypothetical protein